MLRKTPDFSAPLPVPLLVPDVMTLKTLADVRTLLGHLPAHCRAPDAWKNVAATLAGAAFGVNDPEEVAIALRLAFMLEGGECKPLSERGARTGNKRKR